MEAIKGLTKEEIEQQLMYAAGARCRCGAGLAYIQNYDLKSPFGSAWHCSSVLHDILSGDPQQYTTMQQGEMFKPGVAKGENDEIEHDTSYPFAFYEIKSEIQPSQGGRTTRQQGLVHHVDCGKPCFQCKCSTMRDTEVRYDKRVSAFDSTE